MSTVWRVDAHQHFWRFDPAAYGWIGDDMAVLKRDFLPAELRFELDIRHIGGSVAVQARASEAETDFLLGLASSNPWILGVVGWIDLRAGDLGTPGLRRGLRPPCSRIPPSGAGRSVSFGVFGRWAVQPWRGNAPAGGQGLRGPDPRERSARRHCLLRAARSGAARAGSPRASRTSGMRARRSGPGASPRSRRRSM